MPLYLLLAGDADCTINLFYRMEKNRRNEIDE